MHQHYFMHLEGRYFLDKWTTVWMASGTLHSKQLNGETVHFEVWTSFFQFAVICIHCVELVLITEIWFWIEQRQAQDRQRCSSTSCSNKYEEGGSSPDA